MSGPGVSVEGRAPHSRYVCAGCNVGEACTGVALDGAACLNSNAPICIGAPTTEVTPGGVVPYEAPRLIYLGTLPPDQLATLRASVAAGDAVHLAGSVGAVPEGAGDGDPGRRGGVGAGALGDVGAHETRVVRAGANGRPLDLFAGRGDAEVAGIRRGAARLGAEVSACLRLLDRLGGRVERRDVVAYVARDGVRGAHFVADVADHFGAAVAAAVLTSGNRDAAAADSQNPQDPHDEDAHARIFAEAADPRNLCSGCHRAVDARGPVVIHRQGWAHVSCAGGAL